MLHSSILKYNLTESLEWSMKEARNPNYTYEVAMSI